MTPAKLRELDSGRERRAEAPDAFAWRRSIALSTAVLVSVSLGYVWHSRHAERDLSFTIGAKPAGRVGAWLASQSDQLEVAFSDGSQLKLAPHSTGRVLSLNAKGARVVLERGVADVHVNPRSGAHWQFNAGPFLVDVTGTRFDLDWSPDQEELVLTLKEGKVNVAGCSLGKGQPLRAPQVLRASCKSARFDIASLPPPTPSASALLGTSSESDAPHEPEAKPQAPASSILSWSALARAGKYNAAYAAAHAEGISARNPHVSARDLVLLGDVARFTGHWAEANGLYATARARAPRSNEAARAAFMLGRTAFDQRGAYLEAGRWFNTYLREQPNGAFAAEARGRLMEALERSGNGASARSAATEYLRLYPSGPHAPLAKKLAE